MFYTIYKITNKINGKVYIGSHKTRNLDDNYMGSGKYLIRAIEKHGIANFTKEILFVFDNPEEMYAKEAELVNDDFLAEANTYNLKRGGFGGFDYLNSPGFDNPAHRPEHINELNKRRITKLKTDPDYLRSFGNKVSLGLRSKSDQSWRTINKVGFTFKDRKHKPSSKLIIGEKNSINQTGTGNSQYGTFWISNPLTQENKKLKVGQDIPDGWLKGKNVKFKDCTVCNKPHTHPYKKRCSDCTTLRLKRRSSTKKENKVQFVDCKRCGTEFSTVNKNRTTCNQCVSKNSSKPVKDNYGNIFESLTQAAKFHKVSVETIRNRIKANRYKYL